MRSLILIIILIVAIGAAVVGIAGATDPGVGYGGPVQQVSMATTPIPSTDPGAGQCNGGTTINAILGFCNPIAETLTYSANTPFAFTGTGPLTFNASAISTSTDAFQFKNAGTCTAANNLVNFLNGTTSEMSVQCNGQVNLAGNLLTFLGTGVVTQTVGTNASTDAFGLTNNGTCSAGSNLLRMRAGATNEFTVTCAGSAAVVEHYNNTGSACSASGANFHDVCAPGVTTTTATSPLSFNVAYATTPVCNANANFNTGAIWISALSNTSVTVTWATSGTGTIYVSCEGNPN